jgi:hypothetical protein
MLLNMSRDIRVGKLTAAAYWTTVIRFPAEGPFLTAALPVLELTRPHV